MAERLSFPERKWVFVPLNVPNREVYEVPFGIYYMKDKTLKVNVRRNPKYLELRRIIQLLFDLNPDAEERSDRMTESWMRKERLIYRNVPRSAVDAGISKFQINGWTVTPVKRFANWYRR